jgi:hypothetical protein
MKPLCHNLTSKYASKNRSAGTAEHCRTELNEYELPVHRRKHGFREISILAVKFSDLAYVIRKESTHNNACIFPILGEAEELWDDVAIAMYPSRAAMMEMVASPAYQAIAVHREAGLSGPVKYRNPCNAGPLVKLKRLDKPAVGREVT